MPYYLYDLITLKASAKRANAIIVSSKFEYEDALEFGIPKEKIHIIPMGTEVDDTPKQTKKNEILQLLFVGRVARVRNLELLLRTVGNLNFPFHLTIVGGEEKTSSITKSGYLNELMALTQQLKLKGQVTFAGRKDPEELKSYYQKADLFLYPSTYENFGQPILEAGSHGLPVIATPVGVARDIIVDGETGYITKHNPQEISERILLLRDNKIREQMGVQIKTLIKNKFDWDNIMHQYVTLYNSI